MRYAIPAAICWTLMGLAGSALAQPSLEPGSWRIAVSSTTNGKPDAAQDEETCLRADELKDLAAYFSPALEGVQAKCTTTNKPRLGGATFAHRLSCRGNGFTIEMLTRVTIDSPTRFRVNVRSDTKTVHESAVVVTDAIAERRGPCDPK